MPVTIALIFTVLFSHGAVGSWIVVIAVIPSAPAGQAGSTGTQVAPQFAGARTTGPVKSFSLKSVSAESLRMNAVALLVGVEAGNGSPAPSFHAAAAPARPVWPTASMTAPAALRS